MPWLLTQAVRVVGSLQRCDSCLCVQPLGRSFLDIKVAYTGTITTVLPLRRFWESLPSLGFSDLSCCHCAKVGQGCVVSFFCKASENAETKTKKSHTVFLRSPRLIKRALSLARCNRWQLELRQCSSGLSQTMPSVNVRPHAPVDQRHNICYSKNTVSLFSMTTTLTSALYTEEPVCYKAM